MFTRSRISKSSFLGLRFVPYAYEVREENISLGSQHIYLSTRASSSYELPLDVLRHCFCTPLLYFSPVHNSYPTVIVNTLHLSLARTFTRTLASAVVDSTRFEISVLCWLHIDKSRPMSSFFSRFSVTSSCRPSPNHHHSPLEHSARVPPWWLCLSLSEYFLHIFVQKKEEKKIFIAWKTITVLYIPCVCQ